MSCPNGMLTPVECGFSVREPVRRLAVSEEYLSGGCPWASHDRATPRGTACAAGAGSAAVPGSGIPAGWGTAPPASRQIRLGAFAGLTAIEQEPQVPKTSIV
ncbi:hypothetical protein GCM10023075_50870 [Streptosporangium album]